MSFKEALLLWRFRLIVMVISGTDGSNEMKKRRYLASAVFTDFL
jgi:hypothetical protein